MTNSISCPQEPKQIGDQMVKKVGFDNEKYLQEQKPALRPCTQEH